MRSRPEPSAMPRLVRNNAITIVIGLMFVFALAGQTLTGWSVYNADQQEHGGAPVGLGEYVTTGHFGEAVFENFESEFLQMGVFVLLTVFLRQKGSAESKQMDGDEAVDREPDPGRPGAPWPVRVGGPVLALYRNSLTIALFGLFAVSFALHAVTGSAEYSAEQLVHGGEPVSAIGYLATSQFWFESFQNWQSEFMSIVALTVLAIFLRQHGSPESKPVDAPHSQTGSA
jgi:hypothetical protein